MPDDFVPTPGGTKRRTRKSMADSERSSSPMEAESEVAKPVRSSSRKRTVNGSANGGANGALKGDKKKAVDGWYEVRRALTASSGERCLDNPLNDRIGR